MWTAHLPDGLDVNVVIDNGSTNKTPVVERLDEVAAEVWIPVTSLTRCHVPTVPRERSAPDSRYVGGLLRCVRGPVDALRCVKRPVRLRGDSIAVFEEVEDLAGDEAFEASQDFGIGVPESTFAGDVSLGLWIHAPSADGDHVQRRVRSSVIAAVVAMTGGHPGGRRERGGTAQHGERRLRGQPPQGWRRQ